jgi:hypothetical protein
MPITFNALLDIGCTCLQRKIEECSEDTESSFCRKLSANRLKIQDFKSDWERGKRGIGSDPVADDDCEGILSLKGISMNMYNERTKDAIIAKYRTTLAFTRRGAKYAVFKFQADAGKVRFSPTDLDPSHHDFYKCDAFTIDHVEELSVENITGDNDNDGR